MADGTHADATSPGDTMFTPPLDAARHELILEREIALPAAKLWRCWTEPALLVQWYCPRPWGVARAELDVRPGGRCFVVMRSPEGEEFPSPGVYLDVVPGRRLVFTDAYTQAWEPSGKPFFTGTITFEARDEAHTHYRARCTHWSAADREAHEKMGFHAGWGAATDQLVELASRL